MHEPTVLVTGVSGFVATHIAKAFIAKGYHVRGTVRSVHTAAKVRDVFSQTPHDLSLVIVPDIARSGAFDEAVQGVDGVIHTASPFFYKVTDFEQDLLEPAINGTLGILKSVQRFNPDIRRVVITSSFAAI